MRRVLHAMHGWVRSVSLGAWRVMNACHARPVGFCLKAMCEEEGGLGDPSSPFRGAGGQSPLTVNPTGHYRCYRPTPGPQR